MSYEPYQSPQSSNYPPQQPNNNLALFSLILGISSLMMTFPVFCCCVVMIVQVPAALTAIGLGIAALQRINQGRTTGRGMAITGITCGSLALFLTVALFVVMGIMGMDNARNPFDRGGDIQFEDFNLEDVDFGDE